MSRIVTFYSYKGGVGRTLALANVGVLLAKRRKRVLLMDWDLEAPGLDRYFQPFLPEGFSPDQGVIHLLHQAMNGEEPNWKSHVKEVVVSSADPSAGEQVALSVIPSGVASPDYGEKVRAFSWPSFVRDREGGLILEKWRDEWKKEYDFVLVDSRTGITDTGGVCTILLPDFLVLVFTANDQSFEGALGILNSIQHERRNLAVPRPPLMVLPLLSRFDRTVEVDESDKWLARFAHDLKPIFDDWLPQQYSTLQILELTKIPYITLFSFGEPLPVLTHSLTDPELPGFYLENVARLIRTDFREAAQIIDPQAPLDRGIEAEITTAIRRMPIDEVELLRLLRNAEEELGQSSKVVMLLIAAASVLKAHARFASAEPLMRRALAIIERSYGPDHLHTAVCLSNLAILLQATNRRAEAEPLMRRALSITEQNHGPDHPDVAASLTNLARLLKETNRLAEAEPLMRRALSITEQNHGPDHPDVAASLNNLAMLLESTNRPAEAEPLIRRALAINEKSYGPDHPHVAVCLNNLASLFQGTNQLAEAEPLIRRALAINEKSYGPDHPVVAISLNNLAMLLKETNRRVEAEPLMRRALAIDEQSYAPDHPDVAVSLNNLASLLQDTNRLAEAEPLMRRHLGVFLRFTHRFGHVHPHLRAAIENYGQLLASMSLDEVQIRHRFEEVGNEIGIDNEQYQKILNQLSAK